MWLQFWLCCVITMACHCILRTVMAENVSRDACCIVLVYFTNMSNISRRHGDFWGPDMAWFYFRGWGRVPLRDLSSTSPTQFGAEIIWFLLLERESTTALQKTVCSDHMDNQRPRNHYTITQIYSRYLNKARHASLACGNVWLHFSAITKGLNTSLKVKYLSRATASRVNIWSEFQIIWKAQHLW